MEHPGRTGGRGRDDGAGGGGASPAPSLLDQPSPLAFEEDPAWRRDLVLAALAELERAFAGDDDAVVRPAAPALPDLSVPTDPRCVAGALEALVRAADGHGVNTRSARYLGYLPSGARFSSAVGDLVGAALNPYSAMASVSPGAVAVEQATTRWLCDATGLPAGSGGVLTSGASSATLTAVVAARDATQVDLARAHLAPVYVGEHRHHSVDRALHVAGLSRCPVRVVPSDAQRRMDVDALRRTAAADVAAGMRPWLVVPTAGTTGSGTVDPLGDVVDVARGLRAWVHADAAYGGLFRLAPRATPLLSGLSDCDSLAVDPHKALFTAYGTGAVLVRDETVLRRSFSHRADYLEDTGDASPADLGIELTRPFRALRLWLPLQLSGSAAVGRTLDGLVALARSAHAALGAVPGIETGPAPDLSLVTFRHRSPGGTRRLAQALREDGRFFLTTTVLEGRTTLRLALGSPRTRPCDVEELVALVGGLAAGVGGTRAA